MEDKGKKIPFSIVVMQYLNPVSYNKNLSQEQVKKWEEDLIAYHQHLEEFVDELPTHMQTFLAEVYTHGTKIIMCYHDSFRNRFILTIDQAGWRYYLNYHLPCWMSSGDALPRTMALLNGATWECDEVDKTNKDTFVHRIALDSGNVLCIPFKNFLVSKERMPIRVLKQCS